MDTVPRGKIQVYVPCDFLRNNTTLEQKTILAGNLARYCTIFNVNDIIIYDTGHVWKQKGFDIAVLNDILLFLSTPQYLRKQLFSRTKTLAYAGILPPLATPDHPVISTMEQAFQDDDTVYRKAVVIGTAGSRVLVDAGLGQPVEVHHSKALGAGKTMNISIKKDGTSFSSREVEVASIPFYWGFEVRVERENFQNILEITKKDSITIATSKHGKNVKETCIKGIIPFQIGKKNIAFFFGPRETGLPQFFPSLDVFLGAFDLVLNVFPDATNRSIRLEEAIFSTLALSGVMIREKE